MCPKQRDEGQPLFKDSGPPLQVPANHQHWKHRPKQWVH